MSADAIREKKTEKRMKKWREMSKKGEKGKRKKTMKYNRRNINRPGKEGNDDISQEEGKSSVSDPNSLGSAFNLCPGSWTRICIRNPDPDSGLRCFKN
jgi:hypothetical protein